MATTTTMPLPFVRKAARAQRTRARTRAGSWLACITCIACIGSITGLGCSETSLLGLTPVDNDVPVSDAGGSNEAERPPADSEPPPPTPMSKVPCGYGGDCDPRDLGGETCDTLGLGEGQLLCDPVSCTFSLAFCGGLPRAQNQNRPCGTGPGCDPDDLGGQSCQSLGLPAGVLGCTAATCRFDTALCGVTFGGDLDDEADAGADEDGGVPGLFGGGNPGGGFFGGGNPGGGFFGGGD